MKAKFLESLKLTRSLVREQIAPLTALFVVSCSLNLTVEDAMQLATPAEETQRWVMQLMLGLWDLSEGVLLLLILSWAIPRLLKFKANDFLSAPFTAPYFGSFLAEYLRLLAQVLMWGLLLIVPGFWRYCRLVFVPLITFFSKSYRDGEIDALAYSEKLTKGRMRVVVAVVLGPMILQGLVEFMPQMLPDLHILPLRVAFAALSFLISVWAYSLIFVLFKNFLEQEEE